MCALAPELQKKSNFSAVVVKAGWLEKPIVVLGAEYNGDLE